MISLKLNVLDLARQVLLPLFRILSPRTMSQLTLTPQSTTKLSMPATPTTEYRTSTSPYPKSPMPSSKILADSLYSRTYYRKDRKSQMILKNKSISMWRNGALMYFCFHSDRGDFHQGHSAQQGSPGFPLKRS